ncbi:hypothetical protein NDU88_005103 [Pleurodeles waltl]|uniref:Uncharacterized protein n=1 Tax=Pleurodeles waltl TaxID=8319 RepID=A0AAV7UL46_PLEWA|nr:hypothetical protein NDU88_005103 [Pleurodeles waltl]
MGRVLAPVGTAPHSPFAPPPMLALLRGHLSLGPPPGVRWRRPIPSSRRVLATYCLCPAPLQPLRCVPQATGRLQHPTRPLFVRTQAPSHGLFFRALDGHPWAAGRPLHTLHLYHPHRLTLGLIIKG